MARPRLAALLSRVACVSPSHSLAGTASVTSSVLQPSRHRRWFSDAQSSADEPKKKKKVKKIYKSKKQPTSASDAAADGPSEDFPKSAVSDTPRKILEVSDEMLKQFGIPPMADLDDFDGSKKKKKQMRKVKKKVMKEQSMMDGDLSKMRFDTDKEDTIHNNGDDGEGGGSGLEDSLALSSDSSEVTKVNFDSVQQLLRDNWVQMQTESEEEYDDDELSDKPYMWLQFAEKHVFLLGVFHNHTPSILLTESVVHNSMPDAICLELCPWRGKRMEELLQQYTFYQSPKDAESAAILEAAKQGITPSYIDLAEHVIFDLLAKEDQPLAKEIFDDWVGLDLVEMIDCSSTEDKRVEVGIMASELTAGKMPHNWDEIKEECLRLGIDPSEFDEDYIYSRKGVRELIRKYSGIPPEIYQILYTEREKHMIKSIIRAPGEKVVCIVGMAHLDGIERLWRDMSFWGDREFWEQGFDQTLFQRMVNRWIYRTYTNILNR